MKKYKKHLGQHFLNDNNIIVKIVKYINPKKSDIFLEIGPGEGAITSPLTKVSNRIILIEKDKNLIPYLVEKYTDKKKIRIINQDILKYELEKISESSIRIVGNLPYNISTEIIFKILTITNKIQDAHFMLQKEVVDRVIASPGSKLFGRLSVMCQVYFTVKKLFDISPNVFIPKPKVMSSYIKLIPKKSLFDNAEHENMFKKIVVTMFTARRKMIKTSLKGIISDNVLKSISINPESRPETLDINNFIEISRNV